MLEVHAIYNFIGNDNIHSFHDFLQEHARYANGDLWMIESYHGEIHESAANLIDQNPGKDVSKFYCVDKSDAEEIIRGVFECFGGSEPAPESDLILEVRELEDSAFLKIYNESLKEDDVERHGKFWTAAGWVEEEL